MSISSRTISQTSALYYRIEQRADLWESRVELFLTRQLFTTKSSSELTCDKLHFSERDSRIQQAKTRKISHKSALQTCGIVYRAASWLLRISAFWSATNSRASWLVSISPFSVRLENATGWKPKRFSKVRSAVVFHVVVLLHFLCSCATSMKQHNYRENETQLQSGLLRNVLCFIFSVVVLLQLCFIFSVVVLLR